MEKAKWEEEWNSTVCPNELSHSNDLKMIFLTSSFDVDYVIFKRGTRHAHFVDYVTKCDDSKL